MSATSIPADLSVKINVTNNTKFTRENNDLRTDVVIGLFEAIEGFNRDIRLLDKSLVPISKFGVSQFNEEIWV